jgi:hypothetical protein
VADPVYRKPDPLARAPSSPALDLLGPTRQTFLPAPQGRLLLLGLGASTLVVVVVGAALVATVGLVGAAILAPVYLSMLVLFAWPAWWTGKLRIELHDRGLVVMRGARRAIVAFDDVDEVWWVVDRSSRMTVADFATVHALRLVMHGGKVRRVPLTVRDADVLLRAIVTHCSHPLGAGATEALRAGETLTFGRVKLDETGLRGRFWQIRWSDVTLVRMTGGRIHLFTWQRVVPRRSIGLDQVPHPTVFLRLVKERVKKFEGGGQGWW